MNALVEIKIGAATLAEVLDHLERNCRLSATRRRDLISAVNGVAQLLGQHPSGIQADVPSLRAALLAVDLIRHNMKTKRFANIKADLAYALRLARVIVRARPKPQHTAAWSAFLGHADAKHQAWSLSRFVAFCVHRDIEPSDVNDAALEAFEDFLNQTIITKAPAAITKAMAQTWNGIINRKQLNFRPLTVPQSMRFLALPLTSYPDSLRVDLDTYFDRLRKANKFSREGPRKPLKEVSIRNIEAHVRQFLDAAVASGHPPELFATLASLVDPDLVEQVFAMIDDRTGGKSALTIENMAASILAIARHYVKADASLIRDLVAIKATTDTQRKGMGAKSRERLLQFDDWRNVARLVELPDKLMARAKAGPPTSRSALDAMHAVTIAILMACPIRCKNLAGIRLGTNLKVEGNGRTRTYRLWIEGLDVKNGTPVDVGIGDYASALLRDYLDTFRHLLLPVPSDALFPNRTGGSRTPANFGQALQACIHRETGLTVHPHLFRHIAGKLYLERHPGDYETVRRLLGHKRIETTTSFYTSGDSKFAQAQYHDVLRDFRKRYGSNNYGR